MNMKALGWPFMIKRGDALITRSRSVAVSRWYQETDDDVFLMIDDDIVFEESEAMSVVQLAREKRSIAAGAYPVKNGWHLACRAYVGQELVFGPGSKPVEIVYPATGFMAVHRDVITSMLAMRDSDGRPHFPLCRLPGTTIEMWPFFDCFTLPGDGEFSEYLSEDFAFGEIARRLGFKVWLDQSVILNHIGQYSYNVLTMAGARPIELTEMGVAE